MKKLLSSLALIAGTAGVSLPASAAIVVQFVPSAFNVAVGGVIDVDLRISGLGAELLGAFDINTVFDGSVLQPGTVSFFGANFGSVNSESYFDPTFANGDTGVIAGSNLNDADLSALQLNDFTILTFQFSGLANGASFITLGTDLDFQRNFVGLNFQSLVVDVQGVCVSVGTGQCTVPEPASLGLAALALGCALLPAALRRRRPR